MPTIGILGRGSFGQFIAALVTQYAPHCTILSYDPATPDSPYHTSLEIVAQTDYLFLAVPIRYFEDCLISLKPILAQHTILIDVCTIKVHSLNALQQHLPNQPYLSTHPMFGPYSYRKRGSLQGLRVVICGHSLVPEQFKSILSLFQLLQLDIIQCSSDQHDQMLARSLFLTHYLTQIVVAAEMENTEIDTVSFGNLMDVIESVRNDKQLFLDVWTYNPYCKDTIQKIDTARKQIDKELLDFC